MFLRNLKFITIYPIHSTICRNRKEFIQNFITFHLKRKNEVFVSSINNQTDYLVRHYYLKKNFFHMIFNGVGTDKFCIKPDYFNKIEFLKGIGVANNHKVILKVAGFRKEKGHIDAINAFVELKKFHDRTSLIMVGDNRVEYYNRLKEYINDQAVKDVFLVPEKQVVDIRHFYWSSDIFLLTSNKVETFSIAALEAMSSGLPCVLTDIGGAGNIIDHGSNGILVKPNDIISIKEGLLKIINRLDRLDNQSIREFVVRKYSIKNSINSYLNLIADFYAD